ncbi:type 1 periplasmic-binding domain-containing protein [Staphylococcus chromogenes]|uniref:hypothetical protein n=1 Tax=Staphylococcus chromogenes TaxID=46126 RepID=UPI0021D0B10F|nr:hypothetical protein [Staphylococcus chromogenes]UXS75347.1 hypothetical protein MUA20_10265 [Staphylococcus chromogenes]
MRRKEKESYNTLKKIIMFLITLLHILEIELLSQSVFQYLILITPFFSKVSYELTKNFYEDGYKSFIHQTFCSPNKEEEVLISLKKNEIDAVILCSVENQVDIIEEYSKYGLIISINDTNQTKSISNFHFDEFNIGKDATEYLIKKGINNIAISIDNPFNGAQKLRLEGYKEALLENKINFKEEYIFSSAFTIDDGIKIGMKI